MYQMQNLNLETAYYAQEWQKLWEEAEQLIGQIYSQKLRGKEMEKLQGLSGNNN